VVVPDLPPRLPPTPRRSAALGQIAALLLLSFAANWLLSHYRPNPSAMAVDLESAAIAARTYVAACFAESPMQKLAFLSGVLFVVSYTVRALRVIWRNNL
jgi:hypothetical protein